MNTGIVAAVGAVLSQLTIKKIPHVVDNYQKPAMIGIYSCLLSGWCLLHGDK